MSTSSSQQQQQRRRQLMQGPRPAPLRVHSDSHRICSRRKPPPQLRQPHIIYTLSPKVVHAHPADFMSVVQRLTGATASTFIQPQRRPSSSSLQSASALRRLPFPFQLQPTAGAPPRGHLVSPAAALAQGRPTGIMSPAPSFFSALGAGGINLFGELSSPAFHGCNAALPPGCTAVVDAAPSPPNNPTYLHYLSAASTPSLHYNSWDDHVFNNHPADL